MPEGSTMRYMNAWILECHTLLLHEVIAPECVLM